MLVRGNTVAESQRWAAQVLGIGASVKIPPRLPLLAEPPLGSAFEGELAGLFEQPLAMQADAAKIAPRVSAAIA